MTYIVYKSMVQTFETSIIEDEEDDTETQKDHDGEENEDDEDSDENEGVEESDEDEEEDVFIETDKKEIESNEISGKDNEGDEGSGDKRYLRDYDPESISEKIDELRSGKGDDYIDELLPLEQDNKTVSNGDSLMDESKSDKNVKEKKVKKKVEKKTLKTVNIRKPDDQGSKSLADLGRVLTFRFLNA